MLLKLVSTTTEMATSTLKTSLKKSEFRAVLNFNFGKFLWSWVQKDDIQVTDKKE